MVIENGIAFYIKHLDLKRIIKLFEGKVSERV